MPKEIFAGIEDSEVVVVFLTRAYIDKASISFRLNKLFVNVGQPTSFHARAE